RRQQAAVQDGGHDDREHGGAVLDREGDPFLSGRRRRGGGGKPRPPPPNQTPPYPRRPLVHHRPATDQRRKRPRRGPGSSGRGNAASTRRMRSARSPAPTVTGADGCTPSTLTRVNGSGGSGPTTRSSLP